MSAADRLPAFLLTTFVLLLFWSGWHPRNCFTWVLEVTPAVLGVAVLIATYARFRFTPLAYTLMSLHALVLLVGGHYTYVEVPLFNWLRDTLDLTRNHYDRLGHIAQGFVPAIIARELLLRTSALRPGRWLFFVVLCICLAISAAYELVEWLVAELTGESAEAFLALQGDQWDTQKDMALALAGALVSLLTLAPWHNRQIASLSSRPPGGARPTTSPAED